MDSDSRLGGYGMSTGRGFRNVAIWHHDVTAPRPVVVWAWLLRDERSWGFVHKLAKWQTGGPVAAGLQLLSYQRQKLIPRFLILPKRPQHRTRHRARMLLLHAPHHHAEMLRLGNDANPQRVQHI